MKTKKFLKRFFQKNSFFSRKGFSLTELLIYTGIFTITTGLMIGVVSTVSNVQTREAANVEVNDQSQFVMNAIKGVLTDARIVDITAGEAVSTLKLRMSDTAKDPTYIYLENGIVYKKETESGTPTPLTDDSVTISSLTFKRLVNPPGKDVVKIDMAVTYNSSDAKQQVTRNYRSAVAKVSAITFDSDLLPSTDNTYNVGASNPRWLNGFFSGNVSVGGLLNVGTASSDPTGQNGSIYYNTGSHAFRGYVNGAWADFGSGGGGSGSWSVSGNNLYTTGSVGIGTSTISNKLTVTGNASISGNVGIGTTSPAYKLDVNGTANMSILSIGGSSVTATPTEINYLSGVTSSIQTQINSKTAASGTITGLVQSTASGNSYFTGGNVGVGTASPGSLLHVAGDLTIGTASDVDRIIGRTGTYTGGLRKLTLRAGSTTDNTSGTGGAYISLSNALNASGAYGDINYATNDGGAGSADHLFYTNGTQRMIIDGSTGNVGIGATSPAARLEVKSSAANSRIQRWSQSGGGYAAYLYETSASDTYLAIQNAAQADTVKLNTNGDSFFNGGNVGIGATAPLEKLHVKTAGDVTMILETGASDAYTAYIESRYAATYKGGRIGFDLQSGGGSDLLFDTAASGSDSYATKMIIKRDGKVGIGTASPGYALDVSGSVRATAFYYSSDERLKENITRITGAIGKIKQLRGVTFNWKKDGTAGIGLVAQEVEKVFPEVVSIDNNGMKSVQYGNLVAPLIEAVKEQQKEIEELEGRLEKVEALIK